MNDSHTPGKTQKKLRRIVRVLSSVKLRFISSGRFEHPQYDSGDSNDRADFLPFLVKKTAKQLRLDKERLCHGLLQHCVVILKSPYFSRWALATGSAEKASRGSVSAQ
ncbi:hypothetical protein [Caballeronia sp. LZ032]|uniref:hypothetical protein n=1 Tax=Caballeronia sp. LZ032 TaxID=3038565 RepID=UPI00286AB092|nr:hypothetical protein [Caballeronia sp. LZ032]